MVNGNGAGGAGKDGGRQRTSFTSSSTLVLYASSPAGAADGGIARSIFSRAACFMFSRR